MQQKYFGQTFDPLKLNEEIRSVENVQKVSKFILLHIKTALNRIPTTLEAFI